MTARRTALMVAAMIVLTGPASVGSPRDTGEFVEERVGR